MQITSCKNENQLRQLVRETWRAPFSITHAIIFKTNDLEVTATTFRMLASELGARFISLDLRGDLTSQQIELLARKGPRVVLINGIETMTDVGRKSLPAAINAGGRALPIVTWVLDNAELETPANDMSYEHPSIAYAA